MEEFRVAGDVRGHQPGRGDPPEVQSPRRRGESPHPHSSPTFTSFILKNGVRTKGERSRGQQPNPTGRPRAACSESSSAPLCRARWGTCAFVAAQGWSGMSCTAALAVRPNPGPTWGSGAAPAPPGHGTGKGPAHGTAPAGAQGWRQAWDPPVTAATEHLMGKLSTCLTRPRGRLTKAGNQICSL